MTLPLNSADSLEKRSTNDSNNAMIIAFAVVTGVLVITVAILLIYIILRRRANNTRQHSRNLANTSAPLLQSKSQQRTESVTSPFDHFPLLSDNIHGKFSANSPSAIRPYQYEKVEPQFRVSTSLLSSRPGAKPTLSSLSIPTHSPGVPTINVSHSSTTSESLYSQPSASTFHIVTAPIERKPPSPRLLPPIVPQYAHIRPDTANVLTSADTHAIGKLMNERRKRNERQPTRNVSSIERTGYVEPVLDSDTSDDESESLHSSRHFR